MADSTYPLSSEPTPSSDGSSGYGTSLLQDAQQLHDTLDAGLQSVLDMLASMIGANQQQQHDATRGISDLLRRLLREESAIIDAQLSAVVQRILDELAVQSLFATRQIDDIVLLLQSVWHPSAAQFQGGQTTPFAPPGSRPPSATPLNPPTQTPRTPQPPGFVPIRPQPAVPPRQVSRPPSAPGAPQEPMPPYTPGGAPPSRPMTPVEPTPVSPSVPAPPGMPSPPPPIPYDPFPSGSGEPAPVPIPPQQFGGPPATGTQAPPSVTPGQPGDVTQIFNTYTTPGGGTTNVTVNVPAPTVIVEHDPSPVVNVYDSLSQQQHQIEVAGEEGERLPRFALKPGEPAKPGIPPELIPPGMIPEHFKKIVAPRTRAPRIGSEEWCGAMESLIGKITALSTDFMAAIQALEDSILSNRIPQLSDEHATMIRGIPFGIGQALLILFNANRDAFNEIMTVVREAVGAGLTVARSVTCDVPEITVGLIVVRSALNVLKRVRVGVNAGLWATLDVTVEWDQAEAALDYMIAYSCPYLIPSEGQAMEAFRKEWIKEPLYRCWMAMGGHDPDVYSPVLEAGKHRPSIGERERMLWRLRDDAPNPILVYTDADYRADLDHDGMRPEWRERLYAIRYQIFTIREIQQLLDNGQMDREGAFQAFRDMGFAEKKANQLADMEFTLHLRRHEHLVEGFTPARISHAYGRGTMVAADVIFWMKEIHFTEADANELMRATVEMNRADYARKWADRASGELLATLKESYKLGYTSPQQAIPALVSQGALPDAAVSLVHGWDAEVRLEHDKAAIASVKKGWESGYADTATAERLLVLSGMSPAVAAITVTEWNANSAVDRQLLGGSEVLSLLAKGLIEPAAALARLVGMGWEIHDAEIRIQESENKLRSAGITAQNRAAASDVRASKAAQALAKAADRSKAEAVAALRKLHPLGAMKGWLKKGIISIVRFREILTTQGYASDFVENTITEICSAKSAVCDSGEAPTDMGATGGAGNGGQAAPAGGPAGAALSRTDVRMPSDR